MFLPFKHPRTKVFLNPKTYLFTKNIMGKLPPPKIFVPLNMYVRDTLLIYVDETVLSLYLQNRAPDFDDFSTDVRDSCSEWFGLSVVC